MAFSVPKRQDRAVGWQPFVDTYAAALPETERAPVWRPPDRDVPTADLPLTARVERLVAPIRQATAELARRLDEPAIASMDRLLAAPDPSLDDLDSLIGPGERAARALIASWLLAHLRRDMAGPDASRSVAAASAWFWGTKVCVPEPDGLVRMRSALDERGDAEAEALLPYLLDPFGLTTRRALLSGAADLAERAARKRAGTFYTPGDVARLLAEEAIVGAGTSVIDPACGAGVFLRAAFTRLCCDLDVPPSRAVEQVYGIDVDPRAIDACAFVLVHDWLVREPDPVAGAGGSRWRLTRLNLAVANSIAAFSNRMSLRPERAAASNDRSAFRLELRRRLADGDLGRPTPVSDVPASSVWDRFAERSREQFDCVLMNPPFAPTGELARNREFVASYRALGAAANPAGVNLAWPFVEIAMQSVGSAGRAGLVLPLSLAYRTDPATAALRSSMTRYAGWHLRFFDRAPDAVFGDDIKQRICLAVMSKAKPRSLATSRLIRWSSAQRPRVFRSGVGRLHTQLTVDGAPFPKIGTDIERLVLEQLSEVQEPFGSSVADARLLRPSDFPPEYCPAVVVAPTAYNWIGAYRDLGLAREGRKAASGKAGVLLFETDDRADAAYGLIASRVFLWWWRATGDLFHVPLRTLRAAPFPLHLVDPDALDNLVGAGRALWRCARGNPICSTNRGVAITAYTPPPASDELDATDRAVCQAFRLPVRFVRFVQQDADRLANAGRAAA